MAMEKEQHKHPNYVLVWGVLCILTGVSILTAFLLNPRHNVDLRTITVLILFTVAWIKAALVALNFMHLRFESILIISVALVPLILFIIALFGFMPDALVTIKR
ncbi:MAG: cytochrome C oxidase subunit IV family protein [Thermodesulfobacteriota bacterium]